MISPWWWVALAILLGAIEMLTTTTLLVWSAAAAALTAIALWVAPGLGWAEQVAIFAGLSILLTLAGRALVGRFPGRGPEADALNRRAAQVVGREATVVSFAGDEGQVVVDGVPWPARTAPGAEAPAAGERVLVTAAEGIVVRVRPLRRDAAP